jgi:hypothetical protein
MNFELKIKLFVTKSNFYLLNVTNDMIQNKFSSFYHIIFYLYLVWNFLGFKDLFWKDKNYKKISFTIFSMDLLCW